MDQQKLAELAARIERIRREAEALIEESSSFPAIWRNALRIEASVKMMELNLYLPPERP